MPVIGRIIADPVAAGALIVALLIGFSGARLKWEATVQLLGLWLVLSIIEAVTLGGRPLSENASAYAGWFVGTALFMAVIIVPAFALGRAIRLALRRR